MERELLQVQVDRQRLEAEENTLSQGIAQLDQNFGQSALTAEEWIGLEASKAELVGGQLEKLKNQRQAVVQQEPR